MTRSQDGALLLSCAALSSATPYRFIPALSLITLSALANTFGGIVRPICLAAFRLIMNSNFLGCSKGNSAGCHTLRWERQGDQPVAPTSFFRVLRLNSSSGFVLFLASW